MGFYSFIRDKDPFADKFQYSLNGHTGGNSFFGGLFAIISGIFMAFYFFYYFLRCLQRKDIKLNYTVSERNDQNIEIPEDYPIYLTIPLWNKNSPVIRFYPSICVEGSREGESNCTDFEFKNLTEEKFYNGEIDSLEKGKELLYYIDHPNITINKKTYLFFDFYVSSSICSRYKKKKECAQYIIDHLDYFYSRIYIGDYLVDMKQFNEPISFSYFSMDIEFSSTDERMDEITISKFEINTDQGFLFSDEFIQKNITVDDNKKTYSAPFLYEYETDIFGFRIYSVCIEVGTHLYEYSRQYTKIPDVLANTGGMWNTISVIITILLKPYSSFIKKKIFLENIFDFDLRDENEKKRSKKFVRINEPHIELKKSKCPNEIKESTKFKYKSSSIKDIKIQNDGFFEVKNKKTPFGKDESDTRSSGSINCISHNEQKSERKIEINNSNQDMGINEIGENLSKMEEKRQLRQLTFSSKKFKEALFCVNPETKSIKVRTENFKDLNPHHDELKFSCTEQFQYAFNFFGICCDCCFKKNKKMLMFNSLDDIFSQFTDCIYLGIQVQQIDTIKQIILTPEQNAMFNYLSIKSVDLEGNIYSPDGQLIDTKNYWKNTTKTFLDYYNENKNNPPNEIDKKLIDRVDNRINNLQYYIYVKA